MKVGLHHWICALALVLGCDDDDVPQATFDRSLMDSSVARNNVDGGSYERDPVEAATLEPPCPTLDVCINNESGLLYNVCIRGAANGAVSVPACLVDPNGVLYLAPLTSGQVVVLQGWTQSTDGSLSAADQVRCEEARAAMLEVDASRCL